MNFNGPNRIGSSFIEGVVPIGLIERQIGDHQPFVAGDPFTGGECPQWKTAGSFRYNCSFASHATCGTPAAVCLRMSAPAVSACIGIHLSWPSTGHVYYTRQRSRRRI